MEQSLLLFKVPLQRGLVGELTQLVKGEGEQPHTQPRTLHTYE